MPAIDPQKIWSSSTLPTLPSVAVKLLELTRNPETEIRDVVDVIRTDPAISAKLIKAANSSFFGLRSEVKSVDRVVPLLGTTVSTSLALSFSLSEQAISNELVAGHYKNYWLQSVVQASAAQVLAELVCRAQAGEFFLCGLMLDIGRLAMLKTIPRDYALVLKHHPTSNKQLAAWEREKLGFDHAEIGAKLLRNWKFPEVVSECVEVHEQAPDDLKTREPSESAGLVVASMVAGAAGEYFCSELQGQAWDRVRTLTAAHFQFPEDRARQFLDEVNERVASVAHLFSLDPEALGDPAELMVQANEQLAQLALREHVASTQATMRHQEAEREKQDLEQRNAELSQQALHDPLTGVHNRAYLDAAVQKEVARCCRTAETVGVIFADIDRFKSINDTYGHGFGDVVLKGVAAVLQQSVRSSDTLARYGGEEFVVLVSQPSDVGLQRLCERIRSAVEAETFLCEGKPVKVTISLGGCVGVPGRNEEDLGVRLLKAADEGLYESKHGGRNRSTVRSLVPSKDQALLAQVSQVRFSRWLVQRGLLDIPNVSKALLESSQSRQRIGELARRFNFLDAAQVERIAQEQRSSSDRFGEIAQRLGYMNLNEVVFLLAMQTEDPRPLATTIIRLGLLPPDVVAAKLEQFLAEMAPQRTRVSELALA